MKELPWNFCRWVVDAEGRIQMYMNPTIQLHTCYELIEHLLGLNKQLKPRSLNSAAASNGDNMRLKEAQGQPLLSK